jgi:hypothetical protein
MTKIAFMTNPAIRQIKLIIFGLVTFGTVSCNTETKNSVVKAERISPGYNELANSEKRKSFLISDFNTDNPDIENIPRPTTQHCIPNWILVCFLAFGQVIQTVLMPTFNLHANHFM